MNEPMNMATKVIMVQEVGTEEKIKSCINEKGQWHEPVFDRVLLNHGFAPSGLGRAISEPRCALKPQRQLNWVNLRCEVRPNPASLICIDDPEDDDRSVEPIALYDDCYFVRVADTIRLHKSRDEEEE